MEKSAQSFLEREERLTNLRSQWKIEISRHATREKSSFTGTQKVPRALSRSKIDSVSVKLQVDGFDLYYEAFYYHIIKVKDLVVATMTVVQLQLFIAASERANFDVSSRH